MASHCRDKASTWWHYSSLDLNTAVQQDDANKQALQLLTGEHYANRPAELQYQQTSLTVLASGSQSVWPRYARQFQTMKESRPTDSYRPVATCGIQAPFSYSGGTHLTHASFTEYGGILPSTWPHHNNVRLAVKGPHMSRSSSALLQRHTKDNAVLKHDDIQIIFTATLPNWRCRI